MTIYNHWEAIDWACTDRPFKEFFKTDIIEAFEKECSRPQPNLELLTFLYDELKRRNNKKIEIIAKKFDFVGIPWLLKARLTLKDLEPPKQKSGSVNLYVILRGGFASQTGGYGIYVGQTAKTRIERFNEHKAGGDNAGRGLKKHGIQILESLCWPWHGVPTGKKREHIYYESALHVTLEREVKKVKGDYKKVEEWPGGFQQNLIKCLEDNR